MQAVAQIGVSQVVQVDYEGRVGRRNEETLAGEKARVDAKDDIRTPKMHVCHVSRAIVLKRSGEARVVTIDIAIAIIEWWINFNKTSVKRGAKERDTTHQSSTKGIRSFQGDILQTGVDVAISN